MPETTSSALGLTDDQFDLADAVEIVMAAGAAGRLWSPSEIKRKLVVPAEAHEAASVGLPAPAAERLDAYLTTRDDMDSLPALPGRPGVPRPHRALFATGNGRRMFPADVWQLVRRLGKAAGLPAELVSQLGPRAVRHAFATLYLDAGGSLRDLQGAMGHADPRTTRRYDRARYSLDRSPGYALAGYLAETESGA